MSTTDMQLYDAPSVPALPERLSLPEILETAKILAASGYFPTAKEAGQAAAKIMWGQDMGLTPMQAMTGIHVWVQAGQTTMQVSANAIAFLLKRHGFTWKFVEHTEDACEVEVYRHGKRLEPNVRYTKKQAAEAQLTNKPNWKGYGEDMVWNRVAGRIARRFAPEIFDAASIPAVTTEEAESTYPDPRDDLVKALHATYREQFPKGPEDDADWYRRHRLGWSEHVLGRDGITTWNGPEAPETLTRADVQTLLDALESTASIERPASEAQAGPLSPKAAGPADSMQGSAEDEAPLPGSGPGSHEKSAAPAEHHPRGSAGTDSDEPGDVSFRSETPAEHHTAEDEREAAPADGTVPAGESRSDTGLPPGAAPAKPSPTRKRTKPAEVDLVDEAQKASVVRNAGRREVYHPPTQWLWTLPPAERSAVLNHTHGNARAANAWLAEFTEQERDETLPDLPDWGEDQQWPPAKLTLLTETLKAEGAAQ